MNADLDSLLSAYLDGELDAPERRRVEQAVRSDPVVAGRLASLARVRDLVATLSTPALAVDVSGSVRLVLARRRDAKRASWRRAALAMEAVGPGLAAAVVLLMVVVRQPVKPAEGRSGPPIRVARALVAPPAPPRPLARPRPSPSLARGAVAIRPEVLAEETRAKDAAETLTNLLGRGDVHLISVTVDVFGPSSLETMDDAIRSSNFREPRHARIRIVQNITIDPKRSGPGCAYALVMDEAEHRVFQANLESRFGDSVAESAPPSPRTLALLPTAGRVEIFRVQPRATLMDPPAGAAEDVAVRHPPQILQDQVIVDMNARPAPPVGPRPRPLEGTPPVAAKADVAKAAPVPARAANADPPTSVYVVWLSGREPRRD